MSSHGGQRYRYQFLSALAYFLAHHYDSLSFEGSNYEDSIFFKDRQREVIGESKSISRKHWTARALFYEGNKRGPLLQLWERWTGKEKLVLFSSAQLDSSIDRDGWIDIPDNQLEDIIDNISSKVSAQELSLRNPTSFDLQTVKDFLSRTEFKYYQFDKIEDIVIREGSSIGNINKEGIDRFLGYINSSLYRPGERIPFNQVCALLVGTGSNVDIESMIQDIRGQIRVRIRDAFLTTKWEIEFDYNKEIFVDLATLSTVRKHFECIVRKTKSSAGRSSWISVEEYVPIRTVISPSTRGQPLIFYPLPTTPSIGHLFRFVLLDELKILPQQEFDEFTNLFIENSHRQTIPFCQIVSGGATSRFNEKLSELYEDYQFLRKNLHHERKIFVASPPRNFATSSSEQKYVHYLLCPVLVTDDDLIIENDTGNQSQVPHLVFRYQDGYYHVVSARNIKYLADILSDELNGVIEWIKRKQ